MEAIKWIDCYFDDGSRTVLTQAETQIDGLITLGRHFMTKAIPALPLHYHQNCFELTYLAKGSVSFHVAGKEYKLNGGDILIIFPNENHSTGHIPISVGEMYWIQLDVSESSKFLFLGKEWGKELIGGLQSINTRVVNTDNQEMYTLVKNFFSRIHMQEGRSRYEATGYLVVFLYRMLEYYQKTKFSLTPDIAKTAEYVLDNLTENITLTELTELSGLSLSRFKQKFRQQMGVTPGEFINYHKVEASKTMLLEGKSVTKVAIDMGFSSSNYFAVVFKRFTSYTPTEYIRRTREKEGQAHEK